jgi:hypothetical protein
MRIAGLVLTVLALVLAGTANVPPLRIECPADGMTATACHDAVNATLKRGLTVPHPLIVAAHVEAGSAGPTEMGHRATVTYDLLSMPFPTVIELYYDMGGHWGGVADHGWPELQLWWLVPVVVLLGLGAWLFTRGWRVRATIPSDPG